VAVVAGAAEATGAAAASHRPAAATAIGWRCQDRHSVGDFVAVEESAIEPLHSTADPVAAESAAEPLQSVANSNAAAADAPTETSCS
jgi:hypothetical protein